MSRKFTLTLVWLVAFVLALLVIEAQIHVQFHGKRILLPELRLASMKPIITFYAAYIAGILVSWYAKPFHAKAARRVENIRFGLAVFCAVILNLCVLAVAAQALASPQGSTVAANVENSVTLGGWLSFLVAPANLYYFGLKQS